MAVSWRLAVFVIALGVFGFGWVILGDAIPFLETAALDGVETDESADAISNQQTLWAFAPVFVLIAAGLWLIKRSVEVSV